jgi:Ankyrin repeats (3 copies)
MKREKRRTRFLLFKHKRLSIRILILSQMSDYSVTGDLLDIENQDYSGLMALLWAARPGYAIVVQSLLDVKVDFDGKDNHDKTALIMAARFGHTGVVRLLLDLFSEMVWIYSRRGCGFYVRLRLCFLYFAVRFRLFKG